MNLERKRHLGSFYTKGNPFLHEPFKKWMHTIPNGLNFLEPFAGNGQICKLMDDAGFKINWSKYDIDETLTGVIHQDTLVEFPNNYEVVITNPPYLSYHFAKRKKLNIEKVSFDGFPSLYLKAISLALKNADYVAMIIPESFITSGFFRSRLQKVISLPYDMFDDTDMPTCLALWGPNSTSNEFEIWRGDEFLGKYAELANVLVSTPCAERVAFNVIEGSIGLRAIDDTTGPTIFFCEPELIDESKIKHSARLVSRIWIDECSDASLIIKEANSILDEWRIQSEDILLTAFKGFRKDGRFRRRLDFANARAILSNAICKVEKHKHSQFQNDTLF
jgi:hypothetical protein